MSIARFFSKPRWQSKDETVRRAAVARDDDAELISSLPRLAREDADAGVRLAALKRLADPGLSQALAHDDRDEGVRRAARTLWIELLAGTHAAAPALADRLRLLRAQDDPRLIEQIAASAPEADLRLAALQRIERPALILERVTADADAGVRLAALERIDDEAQLARIIERVRKTDKTISKLAAERLEKLRIERGDAGTIEQLARSLCEQLERVLREGDGADAATAIASTWSSIVDKAPAQLVTRYQSARELFEFSRDPEQVASLRQRALDRTQIESELHAIERILVSPSADVQQDVLSQRFDALADLHAAYVMGADEASASTSVRFAKLGAQLAALKTTEELPEESAEREAEREREARQAERVAKAAATREAREQQQKKLGSELQDAITATGQAIEAGKSADAHANYARITQIRRQLPLVPAALREGLADVESQYATIAQWQSWSDGQRRQQLCEELEVLPSSGLHPDALATRLREIQTEWTNLDRIEARAASGNDGLSKRFRALCRKAIEPAKPYFEKRDELRKQGTQETDSLITLAKLAAAAETPDWSALAQLRKQTADALRGLDRVGPRERKNLAADLKNALTAIDQRVAAQHAHIEAAKSDLVGRAEALSELADLRSAMNQARDLQKLWQTSGHGRRARDQAQWKIFRKALDAVFARADSERLERSARDQQALDTAAALCAELEAIVSTPGAAERGAVKRIESEWRGLGISDAALRQRFETAQSSLVKFEARQQQNQRRAQFDIWLSHYEICRKLERGEMDVQTGAAELAGLPALEFSAVEIQLRLQPLLDGSGSVLGERDLLRDCVLEMEQLAGVEPPSEDRQRRLDLQVEKLSARMRGVQAPAPAKALQNALREWVRLGPPEAQSEALETRFKRALSATLETLT